MCVIRGCIQKFPDWVITKTTINTRWEATQSVMGTKLTRLTHKIAIQLYLVAESCTICSSRCRRPVRKLLDTPSYSGKIGTTARISETNISQVTAMHQLHLTSYILQVLLQQYSYSAVYGTRRSLNLAMKARHWTLSSPSRIQFTRSSPILMLPPLYI
jgi:hypothetical protein